ncbi:MAG: hypothetical protein JSW62_05185 [Thermoplasmatales archaeon]|nr:MAG: hypothetical protein JSW62_05185 [Thermoplasmatales archaeon]
MKKNTFAVFAVSLFIMTIFAGVISVASSTTSIKETTDSNQYLLIGWVKEKDYVDFFVDEVTAVDLWSFETLIPYKIEEDSRIKVEIQFLILAPLRSRLSDERIYFMIGLCVSEVKV